MIRKCPHCGGRLWLEEDEQWRPFVLAPLAEYVCVNCARRYPLAGVERRAA